MPAQSPDSNPQPASEPARLRQQLARLLQAGRPLAELARMYRHRDYEFDARVPIEKLREFEKAFSGAEILTQERK